MKKGDRVEILDSNCSPVAVGSIRVISKVEDGTYTVDDDMWCFRKEHLKLYQPTFKVGDRVRLLEDTPYFTKGDEGIVRNVDDDGTSQVQVGKEIWWILNCKLEVIKMGNKFKVGDKVRVIDAGSSCFMDGDVGVIVNIDGTRIPYKVEIHNKCQWFRDKDLELVQNNEVVVYVPQLGEKVVLTEDTNMFEKGDFAEVIRLDNDGTTRIRSLDGDTYEWVQTSIIKGAEEPKYPTKNINYDGCHPVIAEHLQRGEMILCKVWDGDKPPTPSEEWVLCYQKDSSYSYSTNTGDIFNNAEPVVQKRTVVKKASVIVQWLEENGYTPDADGWSAPGKNNWNHERFQHCGKEPSEDWHWEPEWLEEV